jgi:hypothetical protein
MQKRPWKLQYNFAGGVLTLGYSARPAGTGGADVA